ncbi:MAG TPA: hypothetical protein VFU49_25125 [Ktedonobacteraceae bacterium]|nr:hypothetical protein [Ktedonobacteraceae bacterium]
MHRVEQAGCLARHEQMSIGTAHDTISKNAHQLSLLILMPTQGFTSLASGHGRYALTILSFLCWHLTRRYAQYERFDLLHLFSLLPL